MRIALISDWHIGITKQKTIKKQISLLKEEQFDVLVNAGDNCGGSNGEKSTNTIAAMLREAFPEKPILWVNGNHDMWLAGKKISGDRETRRKQPSQHTWLVMLSSIEERLKKHKIHFLDKDGPFRLDGWTFVGHSLWYGNTNPPTNDKLWMPIGIEGDTNAFLCKKSLKELDENLDKLTSDDINLVFCSHFPIVELETAMDEQFGGPKYIGDFLKTQYNIRYFLNGHAHMFFNGPLRYEAGSDYGNPKFLIVDL